jgi:hypothetical protein
MELGQDFSLDYAFHWDQPISAVQQESIAGYGNDEDRVRLAGHFSVTAVTLEALAQALSPEVRLAVAQNPLMPLECLARMSHDHDRAVKAAANEAINKLPELQRAQVRGMIESPMQRLRARLSA